MITIKEFLKITGHTHFRIFVGSLDNLVFESFLKIPSPYLFSKVEKRYDITPDGVKIVDSLSTTPAYQTNNSYNKILYAVNRDNTNYDENIVGFLKYMGDLIVVRVNTSTQYVDTESFPCLDILVTTAHVAANSEAYFTYDELNNT